MNQSPSTTVVGGETATPVADLSYTEASRELDEIVAFFEQREVDVDLLVARLERATTIVDELDRRLRRTKAQVEQLVPKLEAAAAPEEDRGVPDEPETDDPGPDGRSGDPQELF
ncbi:MAG TPA: exodeoxyribonuclease VII small subunit [Acidimicrobiales bacterium]|nr:exodeoxyribonuclease VII small subunit [Acidimicrobiales bacterium]